jgi:hypothetical protein
MKPWTVLLRMLFGDQELARPAGIGPATLGLEGIQSVISSGDVPVAVEI